MDAGRIASEVVRGRQLTVFFFGCPGNCKSKISWLAENQRCCAVVSCVSILKGIHIAQPTYKRPENTRVTQSLSQRKLPPWFQAIMGKGMTLGRSRLRMQLQSHGLVDSVVVGSILHLGCSDVENEEALAWSNTYSCQSCQAFLSKRYQNKKPYKSPGY